MALTMAGLSLTAQVTNSERNFFPELNAHAGFRHFPKINLPLSISHNGPFGNPITRAALPYSDVDTPRCVISV